jgi:hypothetical protein
MHIMDRSGYVPYHRDGELGRDGETARGKRTDELLTEGK